MVSEVRDSNFKIENYRISFGEHHDRSVIWMAFPYNLELKNHLKETFNAKWSRSKKCWYIYDVYKNRQKLGLPMKPVGKEQLSKIHENNRLTFENFCNMLVLKGYSPNTIRTYSVEFAQFLSLIKHNKAEELSTDKIKSYLLYCVKKLKLTENYLHSRINALKFYYEKVLHRENFFLDIPRPKKPQQLPKALNYLEIKKIIECTENLKHRVILKLCYGMGLRVSEIVNLKIGDIDSVAMRVFIARAKGKKDRYVNLPESILEELRLYYKTYLPKEFLFEGVDGGVYSIRSVQNIFKMAMKKAGIRKRVGIHSLRHTYATHLLEYGTDISFIQKLLGHNNIKTTLGYTQIADRNIASVKSPLDRI